MTDAAVSQVSGTVNVGHEQSVHIYTEMELIVGLQCRNHPDYKEV